jgi:hypothetical protein
MLIRALRALKLSEGLERLIPDLPQSPLTLLRQRGRERRRAGHPRGGGAAPPPAPGPWKWGE